MDDRTWLDDLSAIAVWIAAVLVGATIGLVLCRLACAVVPGGVP